jgi:hypothetical protein
VAPSGFAPVEPLLPCPNTNREEEAVVAATFVEVAPNLKAGAASAGFEPKIPDPDKLGEAVLAARAGAPPNLKDEEEAGVSAFPN